MTGMRHPSTDQLAALADGRLGSGEAEALETHLTTCRSCMAAYADAVRYRAAWLATPQAFEPPRGLVEDGMTVARPAQRDRGMGRSRVPSASRRSWRRIALAGGTLALVAAALLGLYLRERLRNPERALPTSIRTALEDVSGRGLVLPGGESGAVHRGPVLRSGTDRPSPELEAATRSAIEKYEAGRRNRGDIYAVTAGLYACGRTEAARDFADEGLRRDSSDAHLLVMRGAIAYQMSDLSLAERCLRQSLRLRRDAATTLDLGIVLAEMGRPGEARLLLGRALRGPAPISGRAQQELRALEPP
ncbi:MAG: zf-HC2 domain-containing protein [Candidatus Eiseniibacteriota bacterium]